MPIYEFKCRSCGKKFEKLCAIGKDTGIGCPKCGSRKSERLFSLFGVGSSLKSGAGSHSKSSCGSCGGGSCSTCR
ncbi:MAG: zinc ribbon domain-containing protein [Candidatus Eisenbacteria bacterium]|nr:zinc ribbon domain-containing protein [Candidatus Eisenbacteria bacterium]